jgi:hypothetical protein
LSSGALCSRPTPSSLPPRSAVTHAMVTIHTAAATSRAAMARPQNLILLDSVRGLFYNVLNQIKLKPYQWRCPACPARCRTAMR